LLGLSVACSSEKAPDEPGAGGETSSAGTSSAGSTSGAGAGSGGKPAEPTCPKGTNPYGDAQPTALGSIDGQIVDEQGKPTSSGLVQICGRDICLKAEVGNNGKVAENPHRELDTPAFKWGDGFEWVKLAQPLAAGDTDLGTLIATPLPAYADAAPLMAGSTATSGGLSLELSDDAQVVVDKVAYAPEERGLRAAPLPPETLTRVGQDFIVAYGLSPLETRICPSPALTLENTTALEPGTALELYLLGLDVEEAWAPYGHWQHVGDGAVSDDGKTLEFPGGIPLLTAIGVKVKP
jgi:hypothetical protein